MAKTGTKMYVFSGYSVFPWALDALDNQYGFKWYTRLKNSITGESTKIGFCSLKDARQWCRKNYLLGVVKGWITA